MRRAIIQQGTAIVNVVRQNPWAEYGHEDGYDDVPPGCLVLACFALRLCRGTAEDSRGTLTAKNSRGTFSGRSLSRVR